MASEDHSEGTGGGPLAGLVVADFSRVLAGPYATMLLADLGAEVIKVESPQGDETRTWMPPKRDETSTYYLGINRGKRSIALDLRDAEDVAVGKELARRADVLIETKRRRSSPASFRCIASGFNRTSVFSAAIGRAA